MNPTEFITSAKQNLRKYLLPVLLLLAIGAVVSGATYAWVVSSTDAIDNSFILMDTGMDLQEEFDGVLKEDVRIENTGDATLYVRVNLVLQVVDGDGNAIANPVVYDEAGNRFTMPLIREYYVQLAGLNVGGAKNDWLIIDGVYYYKTPLAAGETTETLFEAAQPPQYIYFYDPTTNETAPEGCPRVSLTVLGEAIQANGVEDAWGVTLDADGNITGGTGA